MVEKLKISRKEIEEMYDIVEGEIEDPKTPDEIADANRKDAEKNFTFEEYTEHYDKNQEKEFLEDAS